MKITNNFKVTKCLLYQYAELKKCMLHYNMSKKTIKPIFPNFSFLVVNDKNYSQYSISLMRLIVLTYSLNI